MQAHRKKAPDERRRSELAKIHLAAKELRIEGAGYREFLRGIIGQESAAGLDARQRGAVLDRLRALGFRSPRTIGNWRDLGELGVLDDPSDNGLRKFAAKLTRLDRLEWTDALAMNKVIEGLKAWKRREQQKIAAAGQ